MKTATLINSSTGKVENVIVVPDACVLAADYDTWKASFRNSAAPEDYTGPPRTLKGPVPKVEQEEVKLPDHYIIPDGYVLGPTGGAIGDMWDGERYTSPAPPAQPAPSPAVVSAAVQASVPGLSAADVDKIAAAVTAKLKL